MCVCVACVCVCVCVCVYASLHVSMVTNKSGPSDVVVASLALVSKILVKVLLAERKPAVFVVELGQVHVTHAATEMKAESAALYQIREHKVATIGGVGGGRGVWGA